MKRVSLLLLLLALLAGCQRTVEGHARTIQRVDVEPFPLAEALEMIAPWEALCADITRTDTVTRSQVEEFIAQLDRVFPPDTWEPPNWETVFFDSGDLEDQNQDTISLNQDQFFPTIYHEDVAVTSGEMTRLYYSDQEETTADPDTYLAITVAYVGDREDLTGWARHYHFRQGEDGSWYMSSFSGQMNLAMDFRTLPFREEGFNPQALLKEAA